MPSSNASSPSTSTESASAHERQTGDGHVQVFDPPMCCSTGVCGPEADDTLVAFSGALRWLQRHGVDVTRYNPSTTPEAFMDTEVVYDALTSKGQDVLPLILVDGDIVHTGDYPSRNDLIDLVGLELA